MRLMYYSLHPKMIVLPPAFFLFQMIIVYLPGHKFETQGQIFSQQNFIIKKTFDFEPQVSNWADKQDIHLGQKNPGNGTIIVDIESIYSIISHYTKLVVCVVLCS